MATAYKSKSNSLRALEGKEGAVAEVAEVEVMELVELVELVVALVVALLRLVGLVGSVGLAVLGWETLGVEEAMGTSILRICIFPNICQPSEAEELTAWMLVGSCGPLFSELKSIGGASMLAGC